jgi:RNA polymerase sigma-70 factor (ECF subfamily)
MKERPEWTAGIRRGDASTLDCVIRDALPALLRAARAAGCSPSECEDVVHDAILVFLRRIGDFDGRARASTWMQGILARKLMEWRRSSWRETSSDTPDDYFDSMFDADGSWLQPPVSPLRQLARHEAVELVHECLKELTPEQRAAFTMREIDELETPELCKILEVNANSLGVLLFRARLRLRACLARFGITRSADVDL